MSIGSLIADCVVVSQVGDVVVDGYYACPQGARPFPGVVVIHYAPGVDEWIMEVCRRIAHHGYAALAPNLYARFGNIGSAEPDDLAARARSQGGLNDDTVIGDIENSVGYLRNRPEVNDRIGVMGFCLGGRLAYLAACRLQGLTAAVDCWGGGVAPQEDLPARVSPVSLTSSLSVPILGIFGNEDTNPSAQEVDRTEAALKSAGKQYEFHRYNGAGHGIFNWTNPKLYRAEQARDGWSRLFDFYERHLKGSDASS